MKRILKLSENLYVDLETGACRREEVPMQEELPHRLTDGQLKILDCLVRNQGHVCTWDMLEGLFDSESGDGRMSATKNHISRLKKTLGRVDSGFGQEMARKVFQSVHGRGYMFCLPKHGKVIEVRTPVDGMVQVDWEFIKSQKLEPGPELENLKNVFYGITGDREVILQAVCNGIHISDVKYQKLMKEFSRYVFAPEHPTSPVYLMADGGSGKSTLLCQFAVQTAKDRSGWNVMYLDISNLGSREDTFRQIFSYLYQNGVSRTRKNVLCVDSPHENPEGFRELYQILIKEKNPNIYLVAAERASLMMNLLESDKIFQRNSYIRGFYIDNGEEGNDGRKYLRHSFVLFADVKRHLLPQELKAEVLGRMITHFAGRRKLDKEIVDESASGLIYSKKTISDVFMDFKRKYNQYAKKYENTKPDFYIPQIFMDWDEWKMKCRALDADCTRVKLSEAFPYIAACYMFGVKVTYVFIKKMTGYPYKSEIQRLFPQGMGESIQYVDGRLVLRHDTVADNYFTFHPETSLQDCLEELVAGSYLDKKAMKDLVSKVFAFSSCRNPDLVPYGLDLRKLMGLFRANAEYVGYIEEIWYDLISFEFAYIVLNYNLDATEENEKLQKVFSDSFQYVLKKIQNKFEQLESWMWYISLALQYCNVVPNALLEFIKHLSLKEGIDSRDWYYQKERFKQLYRLNFIFISAEQEKRFHQFEKAIFKEVKDWWRCPLFLCVGLTDENSLDVMHILLNRNLWKEFTEKESFIFSIEQLEELIPQKKNGLDLRRLFLRWLGLPDRKCILIIRNNEKYGEKNSMFYLFFVIQELLRNHIYEEPYQVLEKLDYEAMKAEGQEWNLCVSLGMVYSLFFEENPYYNPKLAIKHYQRAIEIFEEEKREHNDIGVERDLSEIFELEGKEHSNWKKDKAEGIYLSIAELYYVCKQYEEAKQACRKVLGFNGIFAVQWRNELFAKIIRAEKQEP